MRKHAKRLGLTVEQLKRNGKSRGKGSHTIWVLRDPDGREVGRIGLVGHAGHMGQKVTRSCESALEEVFGEGWLDK